MVRHSATGGLAFDVLNRTLKSKLKPMPQIIFDRQARIEKYQDIWKVCLSTNSEPSKNADSVVHRLPEHYKQRFWSNVIAEWRPIHYEPPKERFVPHWNEKRDAEFIETEVVYRSLITYSSTIPSFRSIRLRPTPVCGEARASSKATCCRGRSLAKRCCRGTGCLDFGSLSSNMKYSIRKFSTGYFDN